MNKVTIHILPLLFLLIFSAGNTQAQGTMKIPLAEQNDFGKRFSLELNQEATIDGLTIRFNNYWFKWKLSPCPDGSTTQYEVNIGEIKLSETGEEKTISFDSDDWGEKGELIFEWKDYTMQILTFDKDSIQLKVEKTQGDLQ